MNGRKKNEPAMYAERIVYGIAYHGLEPETLYVVRTLTATGAFVSARPLYAEDNDGLPPGDRWATEDEGRERFGL